MQKKFPFKTKEASAFIGSCRCSWMDSTSCCCAHVPMQFGGDSAQGAANRIWKKMELCKQCFNMVQSNLGQTLTKSQSQVGAPLGSRNSHGELPSDMCLDEATHSAFASYQEHFFSSSKSPWTFQADKPDAEDAEASWNLKV